jgi:hypothetical protein
MLHKFIKFLMQISLKHKRVINDEKYFTSPYCENGKVRL